MDLLVVVSAQFVLFLRTPRPQGHLDVPVGILAADHEPDLARRIGGNGGVGVLDHREDFLTVFLEFGDERQVKPLVLGWTTRMLAYFTLGS